MYHSQISFTLDTICPWTYLAKKRLDHALSQLPPDVSSKASFKVHFLPYQLYPSFGPAQEKYAWQRDRKYDESKEKMDMYVEYMSTLGQASGIRFSFDGEIADTLQAHRVIQYFQEDAGAETANRLVDALYRMYFEEEQNPSSRKTLLAACLEAGIDEGKAKTVVEDESEGAVEVKAALRESVANAIDSVPHVVFEGRRRDLTLVGAKEVHEYVKAMQTIAKECS
jgi:predicted DsbA family dithiol-disulfide isomerase